MIKDMSLPIGKLLKKAGNRVSLIQNGDVPTHAIVPLNDATLDFLVERNPRFIKECQEIFKRMRHGQFHTFEDVCRDLEIDLNDAPPAKRTGRAVKRRTPVKQHRQP